MRRLTVPAVTSTRLWISLGIRLFPYCVDLWTVSPRRHDGHLYAAFRREQLRTDHGAAGLARGVPPVGPSAMVLLELFHVAQVGGNRQDVALVTAAARKNLVEMPQNIQSLVIKIAAEITRDTTRQIRSLAMEDRRWKARSGSNIFD